MCVRTGNKLLLVQLNAVKQKGRVRGRVCVYKKNGSPPPGKQVLWPLSSISENKASTLSQISI